MSVVTQRKVAHAASIAAGLLLICSVAACSRSSDTQADSRPAEPATASTPEAPAQDAPLGESTRSAEASASAEAPAPVGNAVMQTAEAAPPSVVKAATADTAADDTDKGVSSLSAEQQELAAEVGDTRHAGIQASSDKASSDKSPD